MAYNYLEDYALKNIWCAPAQDRQFIVAPARVTPPGGVWNSVTVGWRTWTLPMQATRMHVFMIGQLTPGLLGLLNSRKWESITDVMNRQTMVIDLYVDSGVELPRFEAWYMVDPDGNLLVCLRDPQTDIDVDLNTQTLYIRFYSNAFYQSSRNTSNTSQVVSAGSRTTNTDDILALQNQFQSYQSQPGQVYAFVNGYKVSGIDLFTVAVGDVVEYIYDGSVYKVVDFNIADLRSFTSIRDTKAKWLLHYAGAMDNQIDYQDDIDVFMVLPTGDTSNRFKGVYVHRNSADMLRNVTHRDYSITTQYLQAIASENGWTDITQLKLRLHIRYGGWDRALVYEANRINELYKLSDLDIRRAMLGIDSTVPNWQAATLENSAYITTMMEPQVCVPLDTAEDALGYNAISTLLGATPGKVTTIEGQPSIMVPYGLTTKSYGYEYDVNGYFLGAFAHSGGTIYPVKNINAMLVEMISGVGDTELDENYGLQTQNIDPTLDYRMYTCDLVNGVPKNNWVDVTGSSNYGIVNGALTWTVDMTQKYTCVRSNARFLAYTLNIPAPQGVLQFSLVSRQRRFGAIADFVMQIPCGELVLHLNDRPLIQWLDYRVEFPQITILNKAYLTASPATDNQKIDIRFTGFCRSDFSFENTQNDFGFVQGGVLSDDMVYDIRDDKVLRIQANGRLFDRSDLDFAEDGTVTITPPIPDGSPYLINDIVVPTRGLTLVDTYTLRDEAIAVDEIVSAYMTLKLPQPPVGMVVIPNLYRLYSPFLCKLIYDLASGVLNDPRMYQQYGSALVQELCAPYVPLLAVDPSQQANAPDPDFVIVDPHNLMTVIALGIYQYKFLNLANNLYTDGTVVLSGHVSITDAFATT